MHWVEFWSRGFGCGDRWVGLNWAGLDRIGLGWIGVG